MQRTSDKLFEKIKTRCKEPTKEEKTTIISDGNDQYTISILNNYQTEAVNYGQLIKIKDKKGRLIGKEKRVIFGDVKFFETIYIERYNLTLRQGVSRLVRETISFSKKKKMLDNHMEFYQAYNNLIRKNEALEWKTPLMAEGITDHVWSWREFLMLRDIH